RRWANCVAIPSARWKRPATPEPRSRRRPRREHARRPGTDTVRRWLDCVDGRIEQRRARRIQGPGRQAGGGGPVHRRRPDGGRAGERRFLPGAGQRAGHHRRRARRPARRHRPGRARRRRGGSAGTGAAAVRHNPRRGRDRGPQGNRYGTAAGRRGKQRMSRSDWRDHDWHLVHAEPQAPALHMALDDLMLDDVAAGRRPPTLRIWEWASSAVVMGRFQSLRNEVDAEAARRHGIEVVRRVSGGGAMFIEPGNTITYSIVAPLTLVDGMTFEQAYAFMDQWTIEALATLGIKAWYQPLNDITSSAGKIAGAAQARRGGAVLHHVTMAYDIDAMRMLEVLRVGREKLSDKGTTSAQKRVDPLRS